VAQIVASVIERPVDVDAPLMDAGLDSLGAVEVRNQLLGLMPKGITLPSTVVFEHPTARQLAHLVQPAQTPYGGLGIRLNLQPHQLDARSHTTVAGTSCIAPCGVESLQALCRTLGSSADSITPFPRSREDPVGAVKNVCSGTIATLHLFDSRAFAISSAEASAMDPQQRKVLECGYEAFHVAQETRASLAGTLCGVAVGVWSTEAFYANSSVQTAYDAMNTLSVCAGRVSFTFDLHGPALAIDAACAASLVACQVGVQALQASESVMELAAGVNILWSSNSAAGGIGIGMFPTSSAKVLGQEPQKFPPIQRGGGPQASPSASRALVLVCMHSLGIPYHIPIPVATTHMSCLMWVFSLCMWRRYGAWPHGQRGTRTRPQTYAASPPL